MTTPERALAFAKALKDSADESRPRTLSEREQRIVLRADHAEEIASMLSAYAELSQKWQAVLDAEPVATVTKLQHGFSTVVSVGMPPWVRESIEHGTELIIKPAP